MKMKSAFVLIFFTIMAFSQTNRFIYELKYKSDSLQNDYETMEMVLDVNPKEVKFYEYGFIKSDSLMKFPKHQYEQHTSQTGQTLKRKRGSNLNQNYAQIRMMPYYYLFESDDEIKWKIQKETKTLGGFNLQRATTDFGGRKWTAWFATDIPIAEGPYKFRGLPGLILLVEDEKQNFVYSFSRNKNLPETFDTNTFLENHYGLNPIKINDKIWQKLNLDFYNDPYSRMRTEWKPEWRVEVNGFKVTAKEDFNGLTKMTQADLRKYYNPIELDKAFHYPEN